MRSFHFGKKMTKSFQMIGSFGPYIKCLICHHDFRPISMKWRVCDRCWLDYEPSAKERRIV